MLWTPLLWNTFDGVHDPVAPHRKRVDVLIGYSDKSLLIVLEKCEGTDPEEPNHVLTRLGPIASEGRMYGDFNSSNCMSTMRIYVSSAVNVKNDCAKLHDEKVALKQSIREYELQDETLHLSRNDELTHELRLNLISRWKMPDTKFRYSSNRRNFKRYLKITRTF